MHHWRTHAKVEFPWLPPDVRTGGVNHPSTFDAHLRNVSFALISFMGFPAIQICIYNRKYSKLTFSNGSQLMGKGLWQIFMHHWRTHAKVEFPWLPPDVRTGGVNHLSTFDAHLRNVSFTLISFMGFPAILSVLQPFQICIFNRKYSKLTFSNGSQLMGKRLMANFHASLENTCKSRISMIATRCQNWGSQSSFNFWCSSQKCKFHIDIFYGVSCNITCITAISNLHFQ